MWMQSETRADGLDYYEYILLYVDDCLCIYENTKPALLQVDKYSPINPASQGLPKTYLRGTASKIQLTNGVHVWSFTSSKYVHEVNDQTWTPFVSCIFEAVPLR